MALTPDFVFNFESRLTFLAEYEFLSASKNLWWQKVAKMRPSSTKREIVSWLLSTVTIKPQGKGGNVRFDDMVALYHEFTSLDSGNGFSIRRQELEDLDSNGMDLAAAWAAQTGFHMAYYPQRLSVAAIIAGATNLGYDSKAFFATDHPLNPFDTGAGTYCNYYTGSSGSTYNAAPIDSTYATTVDAAVSNLMRVYAGIRQIKCSDGVTPRFLMPMYLLHPPALTGRVQQILNARTIAQAAGTYGGGSADITGVISNMGFTMPIEVNEFAGVDDTSYYIVCQEASLSQLGALVYVEREPYRITTYTGQGGGSATGIDAILARSQELEWLNHGRNVLGYGHPYLMHKVKAT